MIGQRWHAASCRCTWSAGPTAWCPRAAWRRSSSCSTSWRRRAETRASLRFWIPAGRRSPTPAEHVINQVRMDQRIGRRRPARNGIRGSAHGRPGLAGTRDEAAVTPAAAARRRRPQLYLMADQRDAELIQPWADALFDQGMEVIRPLFDRRRSRDARVPRRESTSATASSSSTAPATELWLQRKLRELQKAPGYGRTKPRPVVGVASWCATPEKERYRSHDVLVAPVGRRGAQWPAAVPRGAEGRRPCLIHFPGCGRSRPTRSISFSVARRRSMTFYGSSVRRGCSPSSARPAAASRRSCVRVDPLAA